MSTLSDIRYQCVSFAFIDADGDERKATKLAIDSYEDDIGRCADHNKRIKIEEESYRRMKNG
jgi:uncharacterized cysteine cluster protein YcgN (CxxCxxCC family)